MKKLLIIIIVFQISLIGRSQIYDTSLVKLRTENISDNSKIDIIYLSKKNQKIKTKFLAYKVNNQSVYERFKDFYEKNSLIYYSTAAYSENSFNVKTSTPAGLSVDNGEIVNRSFPKQGGLDALVIVQATGGVVVSNLKENNLKLQGGNANSEHLYKIRQNSNDKVRFLDWAKIVGATVFQTHLLIWEGKLTFENKLSSSSKRERRFLAIGIDENGNEIHCLINHAKYETLYISSKNILEFLQNEKGIKIKSMINMETGASDVAGFFMSNGVKSTEFSGKMGPKKSHNFLIYYYDK